MAKKISKHSRAARRATYDIDEGDAQTLASLPRQSDVTASIVRTTIKNEELLAKKMQKKQDSKGIKKKNSAIRFKQEKAVKLDGKLSSKIEQSIERARMVQNTRKAGWEQINNSIKSELTKKTVDGEKPKSQAQLDREEEDRMVAEFFSEEEKDDEEAAEVQNPFDMLPEVEA